MAKARRATPPPQLLRPGDLRPQPITRSALAPIEASRLGAQPPARRCSGSPFRVLNVHTGLHRSAAVAPSGAGDDRNRHLPSPKGVLNQMYRHSHSGLGLAALSGGGLHRGGVNLIWTTVLAATLVG